MNFIRRCMIYWRAAVMAGTPVVLMPLLFLQGRFSEIGRCAYIMILMAVFWITEVVPITVTSLIPIFLLPLFNLVGTAEVCPLYMKDVTMMFIGGLIVALAIERWDLHRRIALRLILLVGTRPRWLMLGFMITTWFLSMWISNTASTAIMMPIIVAVLNELDGSPADRASDLEETAVLTKKRDGTVSDDEDCLAYVTSDDQLSYQSGRPSYGTTKNSANGNGVTAGQRNDDRPKPLAKAFSLAICYSASIGGMGTLTGTGPNLVLKSFVDELYETGFNVTEGQKSPKAPITFGTWMAFAIPASLLFLLVGWVWLQLLFLCRCKKENCDQGHNDSDERSKRIAAVIRGEYEKLGKVSFAEAEVIGVFILLVVLWLSRDPGFVPGWADLFKSGFVKDACPAIFVATLCFVLSSQPPSCSRTEPAPRLLDWEFVNKNLPWGVVLLLGGGFALSKGAVESGLSKWIGDCLFDMLSHTSTLTLLFVLAPFSAILTEFTSNTATATLLMPILIQLSAQLGIHPLTLMICSALACSFAFMLPVATPPNAIAFSYGFLRVTDMLKVGLMMNVYGVFVVVLAVSTWAVPMFGLSVSPWAPVSHNQTMPVP